MGLIVHVTLAVCREISAVVDVVVIAVPAFVVVVVVVYRIVVVVISSTGLVYFNEPPMLRHEVYLSA